jgi:hypothetical protein
VEEHYKNVDASKLNGKPRSSVKEMVETLKSLAPPLKDKKYKIF